MKKEISLLFILLLIPVVLAVEIQLSKDNYQPRETLQAEITGNFIDSLTSENVLIYKGDIVHSTPVISDLTKQSGTYYFYALLPNQQANFSLRIEDAKYTESGETKTDTIIKEFIIEQTNESALQINPGFVKTSEDFSIKIKSLDKTQSISATLEETEETQSFSLAEDSEKTISFSISEIEAGKTNLNINDYVIPIFIIGTVSDNGDDGDESDQNDSEDEPKISIVDLTKEEIKALRCSEIENGKKCVGNETCYGGSTTSLDGPCCIGECTEKRKSSRWIFGIAIIVIVLIIVIFLYAKIKKRKFKSPEQMLKDKAKGLISG